FHPIFGLFGSPEDFIDTDPKKISWTVNLKSDIERNKEHKYNTNKIKQGAYRPYLKQFLYFDKPYIERPGLTSTFLSDLANSNKLICVSGIGVTKEFTSLATEVIPDMEVAGKSQCFPLFYYEERPKSSPNLFDESSENEFIRRDGVSDFILERAHKMYGRNVSKEDIFYYVYGFLHCPEYRQRFANDLKKMLPRLPLVEDVRDFWAFSKAGRKLADLHINYETVPAYEGVTVTGAESGFYTVEKMRFPKKDQKDTIIFNSKITISNIPDRAYEYVVNGKSAIEWIMERYQVTTHKESGIRNDPNDWAAEVGNPRYILDLLLSVIRVSVETVGVVEGLPGVRFE
ncbi:MAG: type ISP restriction/modification enzyme, partial [Bacteroidota bacterium]